MSEVNKNTDTYSLKYGERVINFRLRYLPRKTLGISVSPSSLVEVAAPVDTSMGKIVEGVEKRASWIIKQLEYFSSFEFDETPKVYKGGTSIKYFGRSYMLSIMEVKEYEEETIEQSDGQLILSIRDRLNQTRIDLFVEDWLRNQALICISKIIEENYQKINKYGVERPNYYLRKMKRRWGSCTAEGIIYFNPELVTLPRPLISYVVMHELCHLKYNNHSKEFYDLLETVMPEWESLDTHIQFSI